MKETLEILASLLRDGIVVILGLSVLYTIVYVLFFEEENEYEPLNRYFDHPTNTSDEPIETIEK